MEEQKIETLFNVPYSPEYNPIELVFNVLKQSFKKLRLKAISEGKKQGYQAMVNQAIRNMDNG
jgi:transposase